MPFNVEKARQQGWDDKKIVSYLAKTRGVKVSDINPSASVDSVIDFLAKQQTQPMGSPGQIGQAIVGKGLQLPPSLTRQAPRPPAGVDVTTGAPAWERTLASFYATDEGKITFLKQKYGTGNVRMSDGAIQFKSPHTKKWTQFDESGISFNDMLDIVGDIPEVSAGIAAQMGMTAIGGSLGSAAGPGGIAAGATKGFIAGEIAAQGAAQVVGSGARRLVQALIGPVEEFNPVEEFGKGAAGELIGRGVSGIAKKVLKPLAVKPGLKKVTELAKKENIPLTVGQATNSIGVIKGENLVSRFPLSDVAGDIKASGVESFGEFVNRSVGNKFNLEMSKKALGRHIESAVDSRLAARARQAGLLYNSLWNKVSSRGLSSETIDFANAARVAKGLERDILNAGGEGSVIHKFLKRIIDGETSMTLKNFADYRSNLLKKGRDIKQFISKDKYHIGLLDSALQKDVELWAIENKAGDIIAGLRKANGWYKKEMDEIFDPVLGNFINNLKAGKIAHEDIPRMFLGKDKIAKPEAMKAIVGKENWHEIKSYVMADFVKQASDKLPDGTTRINPNKLSDIINKFDKDALKTVFDDPEDIEILENFASIGKLFKSTDVAALGGNPSGTGGVMTKVQLLAAAAGGSMYGGPEVAVGALLTPAIIARVYQSKPIRRYLVDGFVDLSPKAQNITKAVARQALVKIINEENFFKTEVRGRKAVSKETGFK